MYLMRHFNWQVLYTCHSSCWKACILMSIALYNHTVELKTYYSYGVITGHADLDLF